MNRKKIAILCCSLSFSAIVSAQTLNRKPIRVFGHARNIATSSDPLAVDTAAPNLVEGREFSFPQGIALDTSANPPILYVSDTGNNRVLAWRNAISFPVGAPADLIIGQTNRFATAARGPSTPFSVGLNSPTGLAVDSNGNLFVADTGNNRILRYTRPFEQPSDGVTPQSVIGQATFSSSNQPNAGGISSSRVAFTSGNNVFRVGLAFDPSGNLWTSDPVNHRVLRFPAGSLSQNQPAADVVLGQPNFTARIANTNRLEKTGLNSPAGVAVDSFGRVYVTDGNNRVLVYYAQPFTDGVAALRIMGVPTQVPGQPAPAVVSEFTLGLRSGNQNFPPEGVFLIGNRPAVLDTSAHRILVYDPFEEWPLESVTFSPPARAVVGQPNFAGFNRNRGANEPSANSLSSPASAVAFGDELFVADNVNHRVVVLPATGTGYGAAVRLLGQVGFHLNSINLIEGREVFAPSAVVVDSTVQPPRMYIADTGNNRVLGFRNYLRFKPGDNADIVIGQQDFFTARVNHPRSDPTLPTETGLNGPQGLAVDSEGNLWVADTGNGRVLRFPKPFEQAAGALQRADLVLGQSDFNSQVRDPTPRTMRAPVGIAFSVEGVDVNSGAGVLVVVDAGNHRALLFSKPFSTGMAASRVLGQSDLNSGTSGADNNRMNSPRHASIDTDDRLHIADTANQRVLIFDNVTRLQDQANPAIILRNTVGTNRLNRPTSVTVSADNGDIWVADNGNNQVYRYPRFDLLPTSNFLSNFSFAAAAPLAVFSDPFTNLLVGDSFNRVAYFVPDTLVVNAANYFTRAVAPGTIVSICPPIAGTNSPRPCFPPQPALFGAETVARSFDALPEPIPLPVDLSDIQILVRTDPLANPIPLPMFYASGQQLNAYLPMGLPESGRVALEVMRPSTGRIFGATDLVMGPSSPGFFTAGALGEGQIMAINQDGTINSAANPIARGQVIQLFGTGQGFVPDAPQDGELAPLRPLPARDRASVIINTARVEPEYSGLAPGFIGVWQVNVRIPDNVPGSNTIQVVVEQNSVTSNLDTSTNRRIVNTIAVRQ